MLMKLISWIIIGGLIGWIISLILGRDFKGGCVTYVVVGIVAWVLLGFLLKLMWLLLVIGVVVVAAAWLLDILGKR